jgi:acetyl/propionyl-CoA carboxylase alpha subunit
VSEFYDSLLGKLVVWGESRERAVKRMIRALDDLVVVGLPTSRDFHLRVMREPAFAAGDIDTEYWERVGRGLMAAAPEPSLVEAAAVAAALLSRERDGGGAPQGGPPDVRAGPSPWLTAARVEALR